MGSTKKRTVVLPEYYSPLFWEVHKQLHDANITFDIHPIRKNFWKAVKEGWYESDQFSLKLNEYLKEVEKEIENIVSKHSLAYWIYVYRRISPDPANNRSDSKITTYLVRCKTELSIQKYAKHNRCKKISDSTSVDLKTILNGWFLRDENSIYIDLLTRAQQTVLTSFDLSDLVNIYNLELLAFELWKISANLRMACKGFSFIVRHSDDNYFEALSSYELDSLVTYYDNRIHIFQATAKGVVFNANANNKIGGIVTASYNTERLSKDIPIDKKQIAKNFIPNFILDTISIDDYYQAHSPLSDQFFKIAGIRFDHLVAVLLGLTYRFLMLFSKRPLYYFQRAYDGPTSIKILIKEIRSSLTVSKKITGIRTMSDEEIDAILSYLSLNDEKRSKIDFIARGPISILLPYEDDMVIVDYAWIDQFLHTLFYDIKLPDENFKGKALEDIVLSQSDKVIDEPFQSFNLVTNEGVRKEIDAYHIFRDTLFIVDCKAIEKSLGFEKGNKNSINYRNNKITEALLQVDSTCQLLSKNSIGRNYDISKYKRIVPIVVTPFIEYIPSLDRFYWLNREVCRVLAPHELRNLFNSLSETDNSEPIFWNCYLIR